MFTLIGLYVVKMAEDLNTSEIIGNSSITRMCVRCNVLGPMYVLGSVRVLGTMCVLGAMCVLGSPRPAGC